MDEKPYANEHSARLQDPGKFNPDTFRRVNGGTIYGSITVPKTIAIIWGKLKGHDKPSDSPIPQALRFPIKNWTVAKAKKWLKDNKVKYIRFEPAAGGEDAVSAQMVTEPMTVKDMFNNLSPQTAQNECEHLKELLEIEDISELEYLRKYGISEKPQFEDGESAAIQWVSTKELDRDNEIMIPEGAILTEYNRNPVVLWAHNYDELPIGSDQWIKIVKGKGILAKTIYSDNEFPQEIYRLKKEGHLKAQSVGFIVVEAIPNGADGWSELIDDLGEKWGNDWRKWMKKNKDDVKRIITKWILLEHSDVPVPSNPSALVEAVAKGLQISDKIKTDLQIGDTNDNQEWFITPEDMNADDTTNIPERSVKHGAIMQAIKHERRIIGRLPEQTQYIKDAKIARLLRREMSKRTGRFIE